MSECSGLAERGGIYYLYLVEVGNMNVCILWIDREINSFIVYIITLHYIHIDSFLILFVSSLSTVHPLLDRRCFNIHRSLGVLSEIAVVSSYHLLPPWLSL